MKKWMPITIILVFALVFAACGKESGNSQEEADTEGYAKFDDDKAYSVGFLLEGDTLQIIVLSGSF